MIRETRELLVALKQMNETIPQLVLDILAGSLSEKRQVAFGELLVQLGRLVQDHARTAAPDVIQGETGELPPIAPSSRPL